MTDPMINCNTRLMLQQLPEYIYSFIGEDVYAYIYCKPRRFELVVSSHHRTGN